jgi:putative effector of murein hydrolase LrgA (UPF0299 family)
MIPFLGLAQFRFTVAGSTFLVRSLGILFFPVSVQIPDKV